MQDLGAGTLWEVVSLRHRAQSTVLWPFWWRYFSKITTWISKKDGKFYWSWSVCKLHDIAGVPNLGAFAYLNVYIQAHKNRGAGGRSLLGKSFAPLEKCVGHSLKNLGPSQKNLCPLYFPKLVAGLVTFKVRIQGKNNFVSLFFQIF